LNKISGEWFSDWFSTPYYAILYQHRNETEAEEFLQTLTQYLQCKKNSKMLDVGCGEGRHAAFLQHLQFNVSGFDISPLHIQKAKQRNGLVHFFVHDMRHTFPENNFDYVFNLFTSFGYFNDEKEDLKALQNMYAALNENGILVIDFLNENVVRKNLIPSDSKTIDNITFYQNRRIENNVVIKTIQFKDFEENTQIFQEKVKLYSKENITEMLANIGFKDFVFFGNYALDSFDIENSPRLITIAKK